MRPFEEGDLLKNVQWINSVELQKSLFISGPISYRAEQEWYNSVIQDNTRMLFAIDHNEDGKYIGNINLSNISFKNRLAAMAIYIGDKDYRKKGCAREALSLLLNYSFHHLGLHKIWLNVSELNESAISLYKSCGFNIEGTLKDEVFFDNKQYISLIRMAIFDDEWNG